MSAAFPSLGQTVRRLLGVRLGRLKQFEPVPLSHFHKDTDGLAPADWPSFIIVTPSYNQASFIGKTIASVLGQDCPKLDYIVQDAISSDGTQTLLLSLNDQSVTVRIEEDSGQADAINRGFAGTDGAIMAYLNSDDLLLPGTLRRVARYFEDHPEVDAIYGDRLIIDETDAVVGYWRLPYHDGWTMRVVDYIPQETLFWRRRAWRKVGEAFDPSLHFAMDWDFILRLQQNGMYIEHVPEFLGAFRVHASQKTSANIAQGRQEMRWLRRRHSSTSGLLIAQLRHLWLLARHVWQDMSDPL